jgi:hypothetical protein
MFTIVTGILFSIDTINNTSKDPNLVDTVGAF